MQRGTKRLLAALLLIGPPLVIAAVLLWAPKAETWRDQPLPEGDLELVAAGAVQDGSAEREASGVAKLYWNGTGHVLRFESYRAESGPNVWFFLVASPEAQTTEEVEDDGVQLHVPGPGQATYRGDFNIPLPMDLELDRFLGVVAWDKTLNEPYSRAPLERLGEPTDEAQPQQP